MLYHHFLVQSSICMSITFNLNQQLFKSLHLPFKNFILNSSFYRHLSSSRTSNDVGSFFTSLIEKSTRKIHLHQIHNKLHAHGLLNNGFIITKFISKSFQIKEIDYAHRVFDEFPERNVFLWNAVIRGYCAHNMFDKVVEMHSRMQTAFVNPDAYTFPYVLKACGELHVLGYGRSVHAQIFRQGVENDLFLQKGLLSFYVKCDESEGARAIFDRLKCKDVVSWTLIISGYVQNGQPLEALRIFGDMRGSGVKPDWIALVSALKAFSDVEDLDQGMCLHGLMIRLGYELEPDLRVALTSLYAKSGEVTAAKSLFEQVEMEDVMLWNSIISGFAKSGYPAEALELFNEMMSRNIRPDAVTIKSAVVASAKLGSLEQAKWMDDYVSRSFYRHDVVIRTALIDMYAKCGSVKLARRAFDEIAEKDIVAWGTMIMSYGLNGWGREALNLFNEMKRAGARPDEVTFLGLLAACSHSGLVDEGWEVFHSMRGYGVEAGEKHYATVVDMLGRAGDLRRAYSFIKGMPIDAGVSVWGALLSACSMHGNVTLGEVAAERLLSVEALDTGHSVQLSNLYASAGLWDGVARVRDLMKARGVKKDLRSMGRSRLSESAATRCAGRSTGANDVAAVVVN